MFKEIESSFKCKSPGGKLSPFPSFNDFAGFI